MGIDLKLTLCHYNRELTEKVVYLSTTIELERDYGFFSQISEGFRGSKKIPICKPKPLSAEKVFIEGVEREPKDAYGEILTYVLASALSKTSSSDPWNAAALAFVRKLPKNQKIVLYWH